MQHFPIFVSLTGQRVTVLGGGETALAKLRLLMKTEADLHVYAPAPIPAVEALADEGRLTLHRRAPRAEDLAETRLAYGASDDEARDQAFAAMARAAGAIVNIVDNLEHSDFITPAIVDRDPVVVAIGTEGAAPVLARRIKAEVEERLPPTLGLLARVGKGFRKAVETLPMGAKRRAFWADYYDHAGPAALANEGEAGLATALSDALDRAIMGTPRPGHVAFVGAGPGDPELLTLKARKALDEADVVIHDRLAAPEILELARREALVIEAGKEGFGPSTPQDEINQLMLDHARAGLSVVRLKSGDPTVFGRLDEEIEACEAEGVDWSVIPGITAASAAVAGLGQSLTRRGRNSSVRFVTGHDTRGFADQDWRALAEPGAVTALYMGKRAARFIQGRLLMHGGDPQTPVTVVENASRANARTLTTTLGEMEPTISNAGLDGPALTFIGLAPRNAISQATQLQEAL